MQEKVFDSLNFCLEKKRMINLVDFLAKCMYIRIVRFLKRMIVFKNISERVIRNHVKMSE